jgi:DNA replication protein DnaC
MNEELKARHDDINLQQLSPLCLYLHGSPGVGKKTLLNCLSNEDNRVQNLEDGTIKLEKLYGNQGRLVIRIAPEVDKVAGENDALILMYDVTSEESF